MRRFASGEIGRRRRIGGKIQPYPARGNYGAEEGTQLKLKGLQSVSAMARCCPVCGEGEAVAFWRKENLELARCARCGMVYASPVPAEFVSGEFYGQQTFYLSADKLEGDFSPVRFRRELKVFRKFCRRGAVLDVGCSTGAFLWQLGQRFPRDYQLLGTDVAGKPMEHAEAKGVPIAREPLLDMEEGPKFDAICFWAVLEHLAHPKQFLEKAEALLKPRGHCFVLVPNFRSLATRVLGPKYRYIMPDHLNYFDRTTLADLLSRMKGLEAVAWGTSHFNPVVIWQDWRKPRDSRVPDEERARLLRQTNAMKESSWLGPLRPIYKAVEEALSRASLADNLWLVARRK